MEELRIGVKVEDAALGIGVKMEEEMEGTEEVVVEVDVVVVVMVVVVVGQMGYVVKVDVEFVAKRLEVDMEVELGRGVKVEKVGFMVKTELLVEEQLETEVELEDVEGEV